MSLAPSNDLRREIIRNRVSQMKINELYKEKKFQVPIHLAMGHEAIAASLAESCMPGDKIVLSHRNAHYNLAFSDTLKAEIDEYLLLKDGMAQGRLGSMNLANPKVGLIYSSSILGNNLCVATGVALAEKVKKSPSLTVVVTGDGAMEEGAFYECLLNCKSLGLACLIIVENNGWSLGTHIEERRCPIDASKIAAALDIPYQKFSGNDATKYAQDLSLLRQSIIAGSSPQLLEVDLTSLGFWYMKHEQFPNGKFINYHAGPAPEVKLENNIILEESDRDPVFVLKKAMGEDAFNKFSQAVAKEVLGNLL